MSNKQNDTFNEAMAELERPTGIDAILQSTRADDKTKQLVKTAYLLGRTEALNEMNLIKPLGNDGRAELENERWAENQ